MTPMWILVKDHLRRNWKQLTLIVVMFLCFLNLHEEKVNGGKLDWFQYCVYVLLVLGTASRGDANILRIWRSLPLRESTLANLAWGMQVLLPPVFFFLIALLVESMAFCFGRAHAQSFIWPFVFLVLALLGSGLYAFVSTSLRCEYARVTAAPNPQRRRLILIWYNAKSLFLLACAGIPVLLVLYPTPARWSDLGLSHLAGVCMAAGLTWQSYRMRSWLLQTADGKADSTRASHRPESAPLHRGTTRTALAQDLRNTAQETLLTLLFIIGCGYLLFLGVTWSGLIRNSGGSNNVSILVAIVCAFMGIRLVFEELKRISMLGAVRCLPLTTNQCIALLVSYPYTVSLAALPCVALSLWLTGYTHVPALLFAGTLVSAGLCPFGMFILGRFGPHGLRPIALVGFFLLTPAVFIINSVFHMPVGEWSQPVLCVGAALLAVLCLIGYRGLRHLVDINSTVYKRKPSDPK